MSQPQRHIFLDTETTGFDAERGDRLIELGAVEYIDGKPSGREFHRLIDPEREIPAAAAAVHGYTWDMLKGKPKFAEVANDFLDFIRGGDLFAHNADFDSGFITSELKRMEHPEDFLSIIGELQNTVTLFRKLNPGERSYSMDNQRMRLKLSNEQREREGHGAILDSHMLAETYYTLLGWVPVKDGDTYLDPVPRQPHQQLFDYKTIPPRPPVHRIPVDPARPLVQVALSSAEQAAHEAYMAGIQKAPAPVAAPAPAPVAPSAAEVASAPASATRFTARPR